MARHRNVINSSTFSLTKRESPFPSLPMTKHIGESVFNVDNRSLHICPEDPHSDPLILEWFEKDWLLWLL